MDRLSPGALSMYQQLAAVLTPTQYALIFVPGMVTGRMFDLGHFKVPFFISCCVLVAATFLVAECTQYWQFLLCQGFAVGVSGDSRSLIFNSQGYLARLRSSLRTCHGHYFALV
jgi:putative intracellular protease/amidase